MNDDISGVFSLFFDGVPKTVQNIDTSHGDGDFRAAFIVEADTGEKYVIKLAENDFTVPERIGVWQRTAAEYRKLGYYAPVIHGDKTGSFPAVEYHGHRCVAYAEDFAPFRPAEDRMKGDGAANAALYQSYQHDVWRMTARIAELHLDYTDLPSAWCLFDTFCPSDKTDEVLENALLWKEYADTLPDEFKPQVEKIWRLWKDNRAALEAVYQSLPASVFQADLNPTNILLDDGGRFVGVYDFNLCGREVFLNYLMRENYSGFQKEVSMIRDALRIAGEYYHYSDAEKNTALPLYRCLKPLSFISLETLKEAGNDKNAVKAVLDETESALTAPIDFKGCMG